MLVWLRKLNNNKKNKTELIYLIDGFFDGGDVRD